LISLVQRTSNLSLSGLTVSATFPSNIVAGHGLLAAVTWIDPNSNSTPYPNIGVADSFGAWQQLISETVPLGGDIWVGVFFVPYCHAGPNGAVVATSDTPGLMFISLHEIAPNAGAIFKFDVNGAKFGIGFDTTFSDLTSVLETYAPSGYNDDQYHFCVFATRTGNINPLGYSGSPVQQEYEPNTTPTGALTILGSQATLDRIANGHGTQCPMNLIWTYTSSIVAAVLVVIASTPAIADPPTGGASGEYPAPQTVTLAQDQGLDIRYTTDGSTPTSSSTLYTGPITLGGGLTTLKAIGTQPATGWPPGFWADSTIVTWTYDIYTGTVSNPSYIIDGDDSTFAELICDGATGEDVAVRVDTMGGVTGAPGNLRVDFEVTQNDLVAPTQTLPAWKVSGIIAGVETVLASGVPGAGPVARGIVSLNIPLTTHGSDLKAKIAAICQVPGSSGGVKVRVYAAYVQLT
jgi:hypothetical protein